MSGWKARECEDYPLQELERELATASHPEQTFENLGCLFRVGCQQSRGCWRTGVSGEMRLCYLGWAPITVTLGGHLNWEAGEG